MVTVHAACLGVLLVFAAGVRAQPPGKPNVVFIIADDLGVNDLGCYGRKEHHTPYLDKLAGQGMRFTCAYAAQSVCSPTRAAVMTGKTPARVHITTFLPGRADAASQKLLHPKISLLLPLEEKTLGELFKDAGYATACIGKWHLGGAGFSPKEQGFDFVYAGKPNTPPSDTEGGKGEYDLTRQAEQFIAKHKDRPFFLYLAHNNPHVPLAAKPELIAKYKEAFNPVYAAMLHTLDDCVGRVLARLDEHKLTERTLVIFTSDNGGLHVLETPHTPATHNTPFRAGKGYVYEGGHRIPLLVRWPGRVPAGRVVDTPVISTDWMPTMVELCGLNPPPGPLDGKALAGLLQGGTLRPRPLFWHMPHYTNQGGRPSGAVRDGDWKLIEHYEDGKVELFNLAQDIGETRDLAAQEPKRAAELRAKLVTWRKVVGAQENTPNPQFDAALHRRLYVDLDTSALKAEATAAQMRPKLEAWRAEMNAVLPKAKKAGK